MKNKKKTAYLETIVFLCALFALNYFGFRNNPGFYGVDPHPYFIIILLMAARYGAAQGLFASAVCGGAFYSICLFMLHKNITHDIYVAKNIVLFFLVGWITGEIRQGYIKQNDKTNDMLDIERKKNQKLIDENQRVKKVNNEMERRILDEVSTFSSLYETSKQLQSFDLEEIGNAILHILAQYLEADKCSIYFYEDDHLYLKDSIGNDKKIKKTVKVAFGDSMLAKSIQDKKVYSIRDFLDKKMSDLLKPGEPIMTAPLLKTDGTIIGALSIESMPFFNITGSSVKIFALLADWLSKDIENAMYFQEVQKKNILDEVLNVYTIDYFNHRLAQEYHRAKRYVIPLSVVLVRVRGIEKMPVQHGLKLLKFVAACLNTSLRLTDIVTRYNENIPFSIILTTTDDKQSLLAIRRLVDTMKAIGSDTIDDGKPLEVDFGIGTYSSIMEQKEEILIQAEENLNKWTQESLLGV